MKKNSGISVLNYKGREANNGQGHSKKKEPIVSYFDAEGNTIK